MGVHLYKQYGTPVGYRVTRKRDGKLIIQEYFPFMHYQSPEDARLAAEARNEEIQQNQPTRSLFRPDARIRGLKLHRVFKNGHEFRYLRIQIQRDKQALNRQWSLSRTNWMQAYDLAIPVLLAFLNINPDQTLLDRIERTRSLYNPNKASNW